MDDLVEVNTKYGGTPFCFLNLNITSIGIHHIFCMLHIEAESVDQSMPTLRYTFAYTIWIIYIYTLLHLFLAFWKVF